MKKIVELKKELDRVFKKKVRLRDTQPDGWGNCISCGKQVEYGTSECHAGHYFPAGRSTKLRWEDDNVNVQCGTNCNKFKHGNTHEYRQGMELKYGEKREREIWNMRHEIMKPTREWLEKEIERNKFEIINLTTF